MSETWQICPNCKGSGKHDTEECPSCNGRGIISRETGLPPREGREEIKINEYVPQPPRPYKAGGCIPPVFIRRQDSEEISYE